MVLAREATHGRVVHDCNAAAVAAGISRGSRITDMRAILPDLRVEDAACAADAADLAMLSFWVRRWCPWAQSDGADGLLLDCTGSDHLHGGEEAMLREMTRAFAAMGLTARLAIAPTIGTAWALARHGGHKRFICEEADAARHLAPLPVPALRLDGATVLLLKRLGLKSIGALMDVPREALIRRFRRIEAPSANPVLRLDQALGRHKELLVSEDIAPPLRALRKLAEPIGHLDGLSQILRDLAVDLCALLEREGRGARGLVFTAYRVDGGVLQCDVRTGRANRDPAHLTALFDGKLDRFDPGFGIEAAALEAVDSEVLAAAQDDLTGKTRDDMAFTGLIDRLVARLGIGAVLKPVRQGSHIPERGELWAPAAIENAGSLSAVQRRTTTPLRMLQRPEEAEVIHAVPDGPPARFRWRYKLHDVARSQGPERIAPEWWRENSRARLRDYYHVEDSEGRRFWLYREGLMDDGRGGNPQWFVHGLDA
ncbi:DNA polymerase Y family protein [Altererythrobacter aquaemixtae]|uniref:DNA polymerase Y family protein n=2 Tax=Pontixanthobacter aquaemixtae TaxID=1958940 RepID=A0A844ZPW4_9SPHN|nr:DNA polymerase Y family protein [Pontixanthobacter aquaemixtae]